MANVRETARYNARERRLSLAGFPEMARTHDYPIPTSPVPAAAFPVRDTAATFRTVIRITGGAPAGLIFELGDSVTAIAAWVDGSEISFRAGSLTTFRAVATVVIGVALPDTREFVLEFSALPGSGEVRMWDGGKELARDTAVSGQFPDGWAASSDGSFASAAVGPLPADVTQTGAPSQFEVIEPLSIFVGQAPRQFI